METPTLFCERCWGEVEREVPYSHAAHVWHGARATPMAATLILCAPCAEAFGSDRERDLFLECAVAFSPMGPLVLTDAGTHVSVRGPIAAVRLEDAGARRAA